MSLPGGFCQECFKGTLRGDATLTGTVETVDGLPTYVARPEAGREPLGLVVIVPDAFGWELLNTRALADSYARRGPFVVYLPDFVNGSAPPASALALLDKLEKPSPDWYTTLVTKPLGWLKVVAHFVPFLFQVRIWVARPRIRGFFQAIRSAADPPPGLGAGHKVGVVGFCWGGRHCVELCGDRTLVDCGFTAHPAQVAIPADLERLQVPLSVANGDNDEWMGRDKMATLTRVLEGVPGGVHEVVVYEGAVHGFAVRGDPNDPRQADMGLRAEDQAVAWFRRQFSS